MTGISSRGESRRPEGHGLSYAASTEAVELGHHWWGDEHLLLAVLRDDGKPSSVRAALGTLGLTHQVVVAAVAARLQRSGPPVERTWDGGASSIASYHAAVGRAEGLALGLGQRTPGREHVLLATLWDPDGLPARLLQDVGVSREAAAASVGVAGVPMPRALATNALAGPAERQAVARGQTFSGGWDLVLALLAGEPDSVAMEALDVCHVTYASYSSYLQRFGAPPAEASEVAKFDAPNARCRQVLASAEGVAAAGGDDVVRSAHGLIAFLWEPDGRAELELEMLGTSAGDVVAALVTMGVHVPAVPLPQPDRTPWGERVDVPADKVGDVIDAVMAELRSRGLPAESVGFNCNQERDRYWVVAHAEVDLRAVVDRVSGNGPVQGASL